jgi:hypothetical protein
MKRHFSAGMRRERRVSRCRAKYSKTRKGEMKRACTEKRSSVWFSLRKEREKEVEKRGRTTA